MPPSTTSTSSQFSLSSLYQLPRPEELQQLTGKSSFELWATGVKPYLFADVNWTGLILGGWREPDPADHDEEDERGMWHAQNTIICRFIRSTLAMNVIPHVRQQTTARGLWHNLCWLYGEASGIDSQGGPIMPGIGNAQHLQGDRTKLLAALAIDRDDTCLETGVASLPPHLSAKSNTSSASSLRSNNSTASAASAKPSNAAPRSILKKPQTEPVTGSTSDAQVKALSQYADAVNEDEYAHRKKPQHLRPASPLGLETIPEHPQTPHPGRRVDLAEGFVFERRPTIISPLTSADGERFARLYPTQDPAEEIEDLDQNGNSSVGGWKRTVLLRRILKTVASDKLMSDKFSFSLPLRRLKAAMEKSKAEDKGQTRAAIE